MVQAVVRKWGNSYGVIIPKDIMKDRGIVENDKVEVTVRKVSNVRSLYGRLRTRRSAQSIKDEMRGGWDP